MTRSGFCHKCFLCLKSIISVRQGFCLIKKHKGSFKGGESITLALILVTANGAKDVHGVLILLFNPLLQRTREINPPP